MYFRFSSTDLIRINKETSLVFLLSFLSFSGSFSQPVPRNASATTIRGQAIDSASHAPLRYVTVVLKETANGRPIRRDISRENGLFVFNEIAPKQYLLILSYLGYQTKTIPLLIHPALATANLRQILMVPVKIQLKEVKVQAPKPLIVQGIDKITYNVDADPDNRSMSVMEILRKVPLVSLDAEDNIALNGNGNYLILINGRTSSLFVQNPVDAFKSMPASAVKSIEVITSPPARYEAEGVGGIINIITKRENLSGYNGSSNIGASDPAALTAGGYITAKTGRFGLSANLGNNVNNSPTTTSDFLREDKIRFNRLTQTGENNSNNIFRYLRGEISYDLDSLSLLSVRYNINHGNGVNDFIQTVELLNSVGDLLESYRHLNTSRNKLFAQDYEIDYRLNFKNTEQLLTLSYKLSNSTSEGTADFSLQPIVNYKGQLSNTNNSEGFNEYMLQADYVQPIKKQTLELGIKSIDRLNSSNYFYKNQDIETGAFLLDPDMSNSFSYQQNIYAAYTALSLIKNNWRLKIGARLEKTVLDANFKSSGTVAVNGYVNLIPNFSLSRKFKKNSIKLAYTHRIERPNLYYLNPYVQLTNPRDISFGNPDLQPAKSKVINVGYYTFKKNSSVTVSFSYSLTNNSIQQFTTLGADTISRTTFGNIGLNKMYGFSLNTNTTLFGRLNLNLNNDVFYVKFRNIINGKPQTNGGLTINAFSNASYRFNKEWRASGAFGYNSPRVISQGKTAGYIWNEFTVNKNFLKNDKLSLGLSINSPFQKNRRSLREVTDLTYHQLGETIQKIRRINMSFSYRFGKIQGNNSDKKLSVKNE